MSTSPAERPPLHTVDAPEPVTLDDLAAALTAILLELQALNAAVIPLANAAARKFPFTFGFGSGRT